MIWATEQNISTYLAFIGDAIGKFDNIILCIHISKYVYHSVLYSLATET